MTADQSLDCFGLLCPMPVIQTAKAVRGLKVGQVLEVVATDPGVVEDLPAWCRSTGQEYLGLEREGEVIRVYIRKVRES